MKSLGDDDNYALDITSISSYIKGITQIRAGYNRDKESLEQINLAVLIGSRSNIPAYYSILPGNITDKGRMMKPYLVESIEENGRVVNRRGESVLNSAVCSKAVADTITRALKAVTEDGTARRLKDAKCSVAGKTGTSFGTFDNGKYSDEHGRRKYQGTFVGFFPAEDPQYSIICTVYSKPTNKSFQGGGIPARAIRTVIDRLYDIDPYFRETIHKSR